MASLCFGCDTGNCAIANLCCKWKCGDYSGRICDKCYDAFSAPGV